MKESIFANLSSEELENIKAGQVEVSGTVAELSEGGHGYAWKCCSDNTTPKKIQRQFRNLSSILVRKCTKDFF